LCIKGGLTIFERRVQLYRDIEEPAIGRAIMGSRDDQPPAYDQSDPAASGSRDPKSQSVTGSSEVGKKAKERDPVDPEGEVSLPPPYKLPAFTTDGLNIIFLNSEVATPQYRLTRGLFEGRPGPTVGIERLVYRRGNETEVDRRDVKQLYELASTDVPRSHGYKELYRAQDGTAHKPWKVFEKDPSHHLLESGSGSMSQHFKAVLHHQGDPNQRIQWYDSKGQAIAIEDRAVFAKAKGTTPISLEIQPKLEILVETDEQTVGLLMAIWIARLRQEGIYLHKGHLTVQASKFLIHRCHGLRNGKDLHLPSFSSDQAGKRVPGRLL
jgi:hypothetical protein